MTPEQADALQRIVEFGELQTALEKIDELRSALACEMDDTRNACGDLNREIDRLRSRLAEAEALLREAREPVWIISTLREASVLQSRDRDRLKSLVTRIDAFLGDKP